MKILFQIGSILLALTGFAFADMYPFPAINAVTGTAIFAYSDSLPLYGYVERIEVMQTTARTNATGCTTTGTVAFVTVTNDSASAQFLILSNTATTGSANFMPRFRVCDANGALMLSTTNGNERLYLSGEIIRFSAGAMNATGNVFRAKIYFKE